MMAEQVWWVCDGCDEKKLIFPGKSNGDWKKYEVHLIGFNGYPTSAPEREEESTWHLCPKCAMELYRKAHPRQWPRVQSSAANQSD